MLWIDWTCIYLPFSRHVIWTKTGEVIKDLVGGFHSERGDLGSEQLGAPTFAGRSNWIGIKFGDVLELVEVCPTPVIWPDRSRSSCREGLARTFAPGRVWSAISGSGDARTNWTDPGSGETL